jgi:DNA-3-methyladenine glycosylase
MAARTRVPGPRIGRAFFDRPTRRVARELLGATCWVRGPHGVRSVRIVETEAYVAHDPANHAFHGRTRRNRSMFLRPGTLYVYRIHQVVCANVVTRPGEAVLLRAGALPSGMEGSGSGPGRLCRVLGLTIEDDGIDTVRGRRVGFAPSPARVRRIRTGPRVGIRLAADRPLRYLIDADPMVSRPAWARGLTAASPSRSDGAGPSRRTRRRSRRPSGGGRSDGRTGGR